MPHVVQILGGAPNLTQCPDIGSERWCSNNPRTYRIKFPQVMKPGSGHWTHWFNMHSKRHMLVTYPNGYKWYGEQQNPIILQEAQLDIPSSITFPRQAVQDFFGGPELGSPGRYFTFSGSWQIAYAISLQKFTRIELWGFELKRDRQYDFERPCFFYWINRAREAGIDVFLPEAVEITAPGDPTTYSGPLYGFETT